MTHWDGMTLTDYPMPQGKTPIDAIAAPVRVQGDGAGQGRRELGWDGVKWTVRPMIHRSDLARVCATPHGHSNGISNGSAWVKGTP